MRHRGFTIIETLVVVIAIGVLAGFALDRMLPLIGRAQRAAFLQTRADLQSALLLEAADRITRGEAHTLADLAGTNPMALLLVPPANYEGELAAPDDGASLPRASWFYDETNRRLVYRVGKYTHFDGLGGPADRVELAAAFVFADRDNDGEYDVGSDRFTGLRLEPVHAYDWPE